VEVRGIVRTECCPCKRETGDCRRKIENLWRSGRGCCVVNEVFAADSSGDDEDDKNGNPNTSFVTARRQEGLRSLFRMR
jgi:hypothetical protein